MEATNLSINEDDDGGFGGTPMGGTSPSWIRIYGPKITVNVAPVEEATAEGKGGKKEFDSIRSNNSEKNKNPFRRVVLQGRPWKGMPG